MSTVTYDSALMFDSPARVAQRPDVVTARTRLRLTRRGRAVIATLASLPLVIALVAMVLNGGGATATTGSLPDSAAVTTLTVEAGETLWGIAAELAPDQATADVVAQLIAMNDLSSGSLEAGQPILVPAHYLD